MSILGIPKRALKVSDPYAPAASRPIAVGSTSRRSSEQINQFTASQDASADASNTGSTLLSEAETRPACHSRINNGCTKFSDTGGSQDTIYSRDNQGQRVTNYFCMDVFASPQVRSKLAREPIVCRCSLALSGGGVTLDRVRYTEWAQVFAEAKAVRRQACTALLDTESPASLERCGNE